MITVLVYFNESWGHEEGLPEQAVFFEWSADVVENPYQALLGSADGFIVTGDSVSMMVEVIYLHKPLAIFPLPGGWLGSMDQLRRSFAHWLFNPRQQSAAGQLLHLCRGQLSVLTSRE